MLSLSLTAIFLSLVSAAPAPADLLPRNGWKIPSTSFNSQTDFNTYWAYNYPWGTDHNGGARMSPSQVAVSGGQLTLTAQKVSGQPPTTGGIPINYLSGTVYAKEVFTVKKSGGYDISGTFLAPTAKGTWPAFWLTGANSWPPEIDLAEWKGDGKVSFNTLAVSQNWITKDVTYSNSGSFHNLKMELRDSNGVDVQIKFYLDGKLQTTQIGKGMVGQPFWL